MMKLRSFTAGLCLALPVSCLGIPSANTQQIYLSTVTPTVRPLVIWHGLGDTYASAGMVEFATLIKGVHPDIFVHLVYLDENPEEDHKAGFYGNVNEQVETVAAQLSNIPELSGGFDAIGFSQGGQFFRAYVERFNDPPVHNLLTFGSQHMGVSDLPACRPNDIVCQVARRAARAGVYTSWAQNNLVQAQYFRDPDHLTRYYSANEFLTSINNEIPGTVNKTYAENLASLSNLIMILFSEDKTVVPKESSWFGSYTPLKDGERTTIPMKKQPIYLADTFGLRTLDEKGGVSLEICLGQHMQISEDCWKPLILRYVGEKLDDKN